MDSIFFVSPGFLPLIYFYLPMIGSVGGYDVAAEGCVASATASEVGALVMRAVVVPLATVYL